MRPGERWLRVWIPPATRANATIDFLAAILYGIFGGLTVPFIPVMGRRLGASTLEISLLVAAQAIVLLLSLWVVNPLRSAHPVRLVVWSTMLGRALFLVMPAIVTPRAYVVVIILHYAIASIGILGYAQVMRAVYPEDVRARIMAAVRVGMAIAWIAASLVGGPTMQHVSFQWVFAAAGLFGVASSWVFSRMRVVATEELDRVDIPRTWRVLQENRAFRRFLRGFFVFGFGAWLIGPAIPILLVDHLRATSFQVGLLGAVTAGMWLLSYYYWGKTIDRYGATGSMRFIFLIGTATPLIYAAASSAWVVLLAGVTDGLTSAGVDLGWLTAVLEYAPPGQVRHYVAIFNTLVGIRGTMAPLVAGLLISAIGVRWVFAIAAGLMLAGAWIMRGLPIPPAHPAVSLIEEGPVEKH